MVDNIRTHFCTSFFDNDANVKGMNMPCINSLRRYLEKRQQPGGFLHAVLCNNLNDSMGAADDWNGDVDEYGRCRIGNYIRFIYNYFPNGSWGSKEKVDGWLGYLKSPLMDCTPSYAKWKEIHHGS